MINSVLEVIDNNRQQSIDGLVTFLKFPSISAQDKHADDCTRCAEWLAGQLTDAGVPSSVRSTGGRPLVLGRSPAVAGAPTVLLYGHYDVQPVDPLNQWASPPFEPAIRDGAIYARGAADDKGQVWAHVQAIRAWQKNGGLPVNLIVLVEGEEEIGSENLAAFIKANADELRADVAVISDTSQFAPGQPAITCGLRGLVYQEITLHGPSHDLHSGLFGGAVPNPANELVRLLARLHDEAGRVTIPGFYDDVVPLTDADRQAIAGLPFDESAALREIGLTAGTGETGYGFLERTWARPTLDINGITTGYQGMGAKTVIPASASAKVSMRLVANQNPQKIAKAFADHVKALTPSNLRLEIQSHGNGDPVLVPPDSNAMQIAARAVETGFGTRPVFIRSGGSIPVVGLIKAALGIDTLLIGFGLPDDRVHSPNEKFSLDAFHNGTRTVAALWGELAATGLAGVK